MTTLSSGSTITITNTGSGWSTITPTTTYTISGGGGGGGTNWTNSYNINYGTLHADKVVVGGVDITDQLGKISERLAILENADEGKLAQFHALKSAYDKYKLIEKIFMGSNENGNI